MANFILVLLLINARTGELERTRTVGAPYATAAECLKAAVDRGPQAVANGKVQVYTCRGEGSRDAAL